MKDSVDFMLDIIQRQAAKDFGVDDLIDYYQSQDALWNSLTSKLGRKVIAAAKVVRVMDDGSMVSVYPMSGMRYEIGDIYVQEAKAAKSGLFVVAKGAEESLQSVIDGVNRSGRYAVLDCLAAAPFQYYDLSGRYIGDTIPGPKQYSSGRLVDNFSGVKIACSALWVNGVRNFVDIDRSGNGWGNGGVY